MRFAFVLLLVALLAAVVIATPAKGKTQAPACTSECGSDYKPICAKAKNKDRLLTFGSNCVMDNYNCQHSDEQFAFQSNGECGGKVSVLLSA